MLHPNARSKVIRIAAKACSLSVVMLATTGAIPDQRTFEDRILAAHNLERAAMGSPPLIWDQQLAEDAAPWAKYLATTGRFEHSPDEIGSPLQGENLWAGTKDAFSPEAMVGLWLEEKQYYVSGVFPKNSSTGKSADVSHYTQIVWRSTGKIGCALARGSGEDFLVCRYSMPGNVLGQRPL